jgi:hypothetical protein
LSTTSRDVSRRKASARVRTRWRPRRITLGIIAIVLLAVLATMVLAWPALGIWPPKSGGGIELTPTSQFAAGLKVETVGDTVRQGDQVVVKVKITNNVRQPPPPKGTPTPDAATPAPEPARVLNASVKVLFFDKPLDDPSKKIVGSGIGNYYSAEGLAPGQSATIEVVATDVGEFKSYEAYADGLWTDKDPVKTPEPKSSHPGPPAALMPARNLTT